MREDLINYAIFIHSNKQALRTCVGRKSGGNMSI